MENLEKEFERSGYLGKSKSPEFIPVSQKSSNVEIGEKSLKKELREDSYGKASMLELLMDKLGVQISSTENSKILDDILGDGASGELSEKILSYAERLGTKRIDLSSSAKDVLGNLQVSMFGFLERAKKKGIDEYKDAISQDFNAIREYLDLLGNYENFERMELGSSEGFLRKKLKLDKTKLQKITSGRIKYVEECRKFLEEKNN